MPKDDQPDLFGGKEERDEALSRVASNSPDYIDGGLAYIANLPHGTEVSGESIRLQCIAAGLKYHHHNTHGSLIKIAVDRGILRYTGRYEHMRVKSSHARKTPIYKVHSVIQPLQSAPVAPAPPPPTNARLDRKGRLIHDTCASKYCKREPAFCIGSDQRRGHLGMWYCLEHWMELKKQA